MTKRVRLKRVRFLNCKREAAGLVRCSGCLFQFHAAKGTTSCPGCGAGVLIDCPSWAEFWTLDECAEALNVSAELSGKLWERLSNVERSGGQLTRPGGDGTGGTVETPDGQHVGDEDDKLSSHWQLLEPAEQLELIAAYANTPEREAERTARFIESLIGEWQQEAKELRQLLKDPTLYDLTRAAWQAKVDNTPAAIKQARQVVTRLRSGAITRGQALAELFGASPATEPPFQNSDVEGGQS